MQSDSQPTRRHVVTGSAAAALGVVGAVGLSACGADGSATATGAEMTGTPSAPTDNTATSSADPSASGSASASASSGTGAAAIAKLADVPVGGAIAATSADGTKLIVAQPTAGTVAAFSSVCTHQGCTVAVSGAKANCPCHGAQFDALTGKVLRGPAQRPLASIAVKISGTDIVPA